MAIDLGNKAQWEYVASDGKKNWSLPGAEHPSILTIERPDGDLRYTGWICRNIDVKPGALYRLRLTFRTDERSQNLLSLSVACRGAEGPDFFMTSIQSESLGHWEHLDFLIRTQSGFNPIHTLDLELQMHPWRPGESIDGQQKAEFQVPILEEMREGARFAARIHRWLKVPNHPGVAYADLEPGMGDGIGVDDDVELEIDGHALRRAPSIAALDGPDTFAFSRRCSRLFVRDEALADLHTASVRFTPTIEPDADAGLGMPPKRLTTIEASARRGESGGVGRFVLTPQTEGDATRRNWPVTQGVPFPRGELFDPATIRVIGPDGDEVPAQVQATSFWEDDSIRWALLDFALDITNGHADDIIIEYGGAPRREVPAPLRVIRDEQSIHIDTGPLKFRVPKDTFHPLADVRIDGEAPLAGPVRLAAMDSAGDEFYADLTPPYAVDVEEDGPLRAVVVARGWHADAANRRFLTYTTRIHAYRGERFVRISHTVTNRHDDNRLQVHRWSNGFLQAPSQLHERELPQQDVRNVKIEIPFATDDALQWSLPGGTSGEREDLPAGHRQDAEDCGYTEVGKGGETRHETTAAAGAAMVRTQRGGLTAAVYQYRRLFPKEARIHPDRLELGLIPFQSGEPHFLLKGTACTSEVYVAFHGADHCEGDTQGAAAAFLDPVVLTNPSWYSKSGAFMNSDLLPAGHPAGLEYDDAIDRCVEELRKPLPPDIDSCGLMNYGDTLYRGWNEWVNLEYDVDLGLYMHFARTGNMGAFLYGVDASRHFLDRDILYHSDDPYTHGHSLLHDVAHYGVQRPGGHSYSMGLAYYYLLTGDRRGLEGARGIADCCHRYLTPWAKIKSTYPLDPTPMAGPQARYVNSRNQSCPARYALTFYQLMGGSRHLETAAILAGELARMPSTWLKKPDEAIHYRWPHVLHDLYELTGDERLRSLLVDTSVWVVENPYAQFGEFRAAQCYGGVPTTANNARLLSNAIYGYTLGGDRRCLDWTLNMYDALMEYVATVDVYGGKLFGKIADNPARELSVLAPHRMVHLTPTRARIDALPSTDATWSLTVKNLLDEPIRGTVTIQPPAGIRVEGPRTWELGADARATYAYAIHVAQDVESGRSTIPYVVTTVAEGGQHAERHGFFAVHALRPVHTDAPRRTFYASLDSPGLPEITSGTCTVINEGASFEPGRFGHALSARAGDLERLSRIGRYHQAGQGGRLSFACQQAVRAESGTLSIWLSPHVDRTKRGMGKVAVEGLSGEFLAVALAASKKDGTRRDLAITFDNRIARVGPLDWRTGAWHHVAMMWDLDQCTLWIDGAVHLTLERKTFDLPTGNIYLMPMNYLAFDELQVFDRPVEWSKLAARVQDTRNA